MLARRYTSSLQRVQQGTFSSDSIEICAQRLLDIRNDLAQLYGKYKECLIMRERDAAYNSYMSHAIIYLIRACDYRRGEFEP